MYRSNRSIRSTRSNTANAWVPPHLKPNKDRQAEIDRQADNRARRRICKNSPFWSVDFDYEQHERDWAAGKEREEKYKNTTSKLKVLEIRIQAQRSRFPIPPPPIRPAFDGKRFDTTHSNVLSIPTTFCPQWELGKADIAPWPSRSEMKYEGDDRIATDKLHGRFPGAPRMEGNSTVNWQHKAIIPQWPFDDFLFPLPNEVEIWMRRHVVSELEFDDEEAEKVLGSEMMRLLDPQDQFLE